MENKITNKLNGVFEIDETYESNNWLRVKIRTFAFGKNRNGSDILNSSLTNFSKAHSTIGAVPIVAKYNDETDNLEGHNATLRKNKNDEYEIFYDTDALGFTSPTSTFYFEEVNEGTDENPDYKTYVVVEDVYLWKRFDATNKIIEWLQEGISPRVSMEIDQVEGQFDKEGYFQIHDFEFAGIAALGSDVEPCFPRAEIQLYTVSDFRKDLKDLMSELNYSTKQEGGTGMEETQVTQEETVETVELTEEVEEIVEQQAFSQEENVEQTDEQQSENTQTEQQFEQEEVEVETVETEEATPAQEFALTAGQLRDQIRQQLNQHTYIDKWGDTNRLYWYVDHTDEVVIVESTKENYQLFAAPYTLNGDNVEVQIDSAYKVKVEYVPFEGESVAFASNMERIESEKAEFTNELDSLKSYKRNQEELEIKAKFADKLSEEEFAQVFESMKDADISDVEDKLFALYGKKNFSIQKPKTETNKVKLVSPKENDVVESPYGDIFEK